MVSPYSLNLNRDLHVCLQYAGLFDSCFFVFSVFSVCLLLLVEKMNKMAENSVERNKLSINQIINKSRILGDSGGLHERKRETNHNHTESAEVIMQLLQFCFVIAP